ncbi:MAG: CoA transferase [Acidobacteria bacterium]|nr:CoA transferase [Acidobacteriota bacterium]
MTNASASQGPLAGITVVDLSRVLSGPYCAMQLADMGARVIKVERPGAGDDTRAWGPPFIEGESAYFLSINKNKESVTLNFKHPEGRRILDVLIGKADVLVENFRPGTLDDMGLGYEALKAKHPRLIYTSISGFGHTGPLRERAGYDAVLQGEAGIMSLTGPPAGGGYKVGIAIADLSAGLFAAQGTLLALYARERTGRGQHVDIAMLDSVAALLTYQAGIYFANGVPPERVGNAHPTVAPYETFQASDGEVVLAAGNDALWRKFCDVAGLQEHVADPRFATNRERVRNYAALRPIVAAAFARRTRAEWLELLNDAGVPAGPVRDLHEVLTDEQLRAREMVHDVQHSVAGRVQVLGTPVKLSENGGSVRLPPPALGEHTDAILRAELGMSDAQIAELRIAGVL